MSVDTRPTPRPICCDRQSLVYRSNVSEVSVDCRWGIGRLLTIAAISLPTGDAKEESIAYSRVLIERGCSSNCRHFEYICNATSRQALSRKRRDSHEHIPECPIDGKKQSIDRDIYMLFASREVHIGKNCARGLEYSPRPEANGRTQDRGHSFSQYRPT